jgi:hypothetical protein
MFKNISKKFTKPKKKESNFIDGEFEDIGDDDENRKI